VLLHNGEQRVALQQTAASEGNLYVNLGVVVFCTLFAGMMSGLTIGLASVDRLSLEVDSIGNPRVEKMCKRIFPVIDKHHWMLVTLLLCNAGAMETLPLFLDRIVSPELAIVFSVTLVLIFGEVVPQAICTGPNQLCIAYWMCPIVLGLMVIICPVSWTIGKILDCLLGEHKFQRYDNDQLKKLVMLHSIEALKKVEEHLPEGIDGLTAD
jgi:metal transporter CNNM